MGVAVRAPADRASCRTRTRAIVLVQVGAAGRRHAGAHARGAEAGRAALPGRREGQGRRALHRRRLQLRRRGPEHRAWPSSSSRTGTSARARARPPRPSRRAAMQRAVADPRRAGLRVGAAGRARARHSPPASTCSSRTAAASATTALIGARNQLLGMAAQDKRLVARAAERPGGHAAVQPRHRPGEGAGAGRVGRPTSTTTLSTAWGGTYVNDFIDRGRIKTVYVQGDAAVPHAAGGPGRWYVRNAPGEMVPFSAFTTAHWSYGSPRLERYNGSPSIEIQGQPAPGRQLRRRDARDGGADRAKLPPGIGYEWTGLSYEERLSPARRRPRSTRSRCWSCSCASPRCTRAGRCPFSVMLVVPLGVLGAVRRDAAAAGLSNDVYFQVGLLTTIGLAAKNAILIVEFAKAAAGAGQGRGRGDAATRRGCACGRS